MYGAQSYTYDGTGNRLTRALSGGTDTYAKVSGSNHINTVTTGAAVRSFGYANSGQVTSDVRDPSNTYTFTLNNNGRNASVALNAATVGSYLYNFQEQRAVKGAGGMTVHFIYDTDGHLIAESDSTGAVKREYIWLDDIPVALVDSTGGSPVLVFIHADHLGAPQKMTDGSSAIVWDASFDPFGDNTSITGAASNPLRFPGQYADAESALRQNWHRDYDPTIGRYIQGDPIGLEGGINLYSYAVNSPLGYTDPSGRFVPLLALGAAEGGLIDIGFQLWLNNGDLACINWNQVGISAGIGGLTGGAGLAALRAYTGWRNAPALGDLTRREINAIQRSVNKAGRPLDVVGSAAKGSRRGVGTNLPIGKGPGTRSDIDYIAPPSSHPYFKGINLPSSDPMTKIIPGSPNPNIGPSIRFEPRSTPRLN